MQVVLDKDQLSDLYYNQKLSATSIAKLLGTSSRTVLNNMIAYGMERRPQGGPVGAKFGDRKTISAQGYIICGKRGARRAEHILIMEQIIGRPITSKERVHHIDGNKQNNEPDNLYLFLSLNLHGSYHAYVRKNRIDLKTESKTTIDNWLKTMGG